MGGNGGRNVIAKDFQIEDNGPTLNGVNQSLTTLSGTVSSLSTTVTNQGSLINDVIHKDSENSKSISNVASVDAETVNANNIKFGKMTLASGNVFSPVLGSNDEVKAEGHFSNIILYGGGSSQETFDVMQTLADYSQKAAVVDSL